MCDSVLFWVHVWCLLFILHNRFILVINCIAEFKELIWCCTFWAYEMQFYLICHFRLNASSRNVICGISLAWNVTEPMSMFTVNQHCTENISKLLDFYIFVAKKNEWRLFNDILFMSLAQIGHRTISEIKFKCLISDINQLWRISLLQLQFSS